MKRCKKLNKNPVQIHNISRVLALLLLNLLALVATGSLFFSVFYEQRLEQAGKTLLYIVENRKSLISNVALFDVRNSANFSGGSRAATISQIKASQEEAGVFGKTGEFTAAELVGDTIHFIFRQRDAGFMIPPPIPLASDAASLFRDAFSGKTGFRRAIDYNGHDVVAAYTFIPILNIALTAKMEIKEIKEPFYDVLKTSSLLAFFLYLAASIVFVWRFRPINEQLEKSVALQALLSNAQMGAINSLSAAIESRDPYTAGHQDRVAELSVAIAKKLHWDEFRIEGIRLGALIHDIGKISIPAEILNRPGKLSDLEFELIKTHPDVGLEITNKGNYPWPIARMVAQHHERIDGSGYPNNLLGNQICEEASLIAVADVVEAMCSHRPYRAALGIVPAIQEIVDGRGTRYSSHIVDACLNVIDDNIFPWMHDV